MYGDHIFFDLNGITACRLLASGTGSGDPGDTAEAVEEDGEVTLYDGKKRVLSGF